ncbi:unnamed protein product, partial [Ascophyllum nodosum]
PPGYTFGATLRIVLSNSHWYKIIDSPRGQGRVNWLENSHDDSPPIHVQRSCRGGACPKMQAIPEPYGLGRAGRYEIIRTVGRGAFGEVLLAWDTQAERPPEIPGNARVVRRGHRQGGGRCRGYVALKTVASGVASGGGLSKGLVRELRALQMLQDCVHVVQLLDVYPKGSNAVLVLEYMPSDLAKVLDNSPSPLGEGDCKAFAMMLLRGLTFMHSFGLLHRDIKPSNLLISPGGVLKIADFGQTRTHAEPQARDYSHQVATRWYRAPELLYGTRRYGFAVDVWAAGAVIGEMLAGRPLFQGRSDIDQLHKTLQATGLCNQHSFVRQITGTPTEQSWPGAKDLPDYDKVHFADIPPQEPEIVLQGSSREARDLTWLMLRLDPQNRPSALEALRHR